MGKSKSRIATFKELLKERIGKVSLFRQLYLILDYKTESFRSGLIMDDYFKYRFYELNRYGRSLFSIGNKRREFAKKFNAAEDCAVFDDKSVFTSKFENYLGRKVIQMKTATFDEFSQFASENSTIFAKPSDGRFGIGTKRISCTDPEEIRKAFDELTGKNYLVEGYIQQCSEFAEFNESSVNSIRVLSFLKKNGEAYILPYAALRLGREGNVADNFHFDGIACLIETASGTVICPGQDQHGKQYSFHPDSHKQIVGYHIPKWEEICAFIKQAATVCPTLRFVGWDVTLTKDEKIILIEGNTRPDPDIIQIQDRIGKWDIYEELLKEETLV